ncbi:MAG TPA: ATP-binding protein [Candidatus Dormibacteraeota bacterium]|nr:ATP-binding protein [Candidatus Dormibacteraeota bacterium]
MASPRLKIRPDILVDHRSSKDSAALRLLSAERSEEIFPILLEEIVELGFPRALLLEIDFEKGEIKPTASVNCDKAYLQKFYASLWDRENPINSVFQNLKPATFSPPSGKGLSLYACPMVYRSRNRCWEAERERVGQCLALQNFHNLRKLPFEEQICSICGMRSYAALAVGQLGPRSSQNRLRQFRILADRANGYLARLFKVEHYFNRMRDMEVTISRLRAVMQSTVNPVILTDNQHRVVIQNRAAERFFRVPEGIGEGGRRAVELNNMFFSAALSSMMVSAIHPTRDLTLVDVMEGEEVLFEAVTAPTYNTEGARTGMVTIMRDVTDLRKADMEMRANLEKLQAAEEMVRQDRDRLNLVIENVGDPIIVADNATRIVLLDPLAKELFGLDAHSKNPQIIKNQAKLDAYLTSFTFSFADKENRSMRLYDHKSMAEIEYAARSGKIYDARGQVAYTVTVLRDFSAWRKLEQLQMERRMLEMEKFAATGRLAGTIAHEINNPLEAIKNAIHLLGDSIPAESHPIYEVLKSETERVTRIVRQMLGLYRNTVNLASFDLNGVVEDTLALFTGSLAKAGVTVEKRLGNLLSMKGSADQFRQLLSNLVVNARDSMSPGGKLTIRTRESRSADGLRRWVTVTIADTGCGIDRSLQKSMFDPFVTTKGEKGTGLGLWIVKGIVENHNGRIGVRSTVGKGTVIKVVFPISS